MNVLIIADDESLLQHLPAVAAEVLVSCGDVPDEIILRAAQRCECRYILAVKGNHDSGAPFPSPIVDLHLQEYMIRGIRFGGFGGAWKYKPRGNYLFEQFEVKAALAAFPHVDVFVAHNSPRSVHDREDDVHLGFDAFNTYINRMRPPWFLHGHQHLQKESIVGATQVVGTYGHRFLVVPEP